MRRWAAVAVVFLPIYFTGTTGQTIYDANNFYKPMTDDYDVRHRGTVFLPPCMKELMNCWELVRPDLLCKYSRQHRQALESICMDMRFQCTDFTGPLPFDVLNVSTWDYCPPTRIQLSQLDLSPGAAGNIPDHQWRERLKWIPKYEEALGYQVAG